MPAVTKPLSVTAPLFMLVVLLVAMLAGTIELRMIKVGLVTATTLSEDGTNVVPTRIGSGEPGVIASILARIVAAMMPGIAWRGRKQKDPSRKRCDGAGRSNEALEFFHGSPAVFSRRFQMDCDWVADLFPGSNSDLTLGALRPPIGGSKWQVPSWMDQLGVTRIIFITSTRSISRNSAALSRMRPNSAKARFGQSNRNALWTAQETPSTNRRPSALLRLSDRPSPRRRFRWWGRDQTIDEISDKLTNQRFVTVVGRAESARPLQLFPQATPYSRSSRVKYIFDLGAIR